MAKKILIYSFGILLIVIIALTSMAYVYKDTINKKMISLLNNELASKISIKGNIDFSLIKKLPYAAVSIENIAISSSNPAVKEDVLQIEKLYIKLNWWDAIFQKFTFEQIEIENGNLNLITNNKGQVNYQIFKQENKETSNSDLNLLIDKLLLSNILVTINNQASQFQSTLTCNSILFHGNFNNHNYDLNIDGDVLLNSLLMHYDTMFANHELSFNSACFVDKTNRKINFTNSKITVDNIETLINGSLKDNITSQFLNLSFNTDKTEIQDLLNLLPPKYNHIKNTFVSNGNIKNELKVLGVYSTKEFPVVQDVLSIDNASLNIKDWENDFTDINGTVTFDLKNKISKLACNIASFNHLDSKSKLNGYININDNNYSFDLNYNGKLATDELFKLSNTNYFTNTTGQIQFNNIETSGNISSGMLTQFQMDSSFTLQNVGLTYQQFDMKDLNGTIQFSKSDETKINLNGNINESDFETNGLVTGLIAIFFNTNHLIDINGNVKFKKLLAEKLFTSNQNSKIDTLQKLPIGICNIGLDIDQFVWKNFEFNNYTSKINYDNNNFELKNISLKTLQGSVFGNGNINLGKENFNIKMDIDYSEINIKNAFHSFENFGLEIITEDKIDGNVSGNSKMSTTCNYNFDIDLKSIYMLNNITVTNGNLKNVTAVNQLAQYTKIKQLKDIHFATLQNTFEISNGKTIVPEMQIKTDALNVQMSGEQTFEGALDYHIKINLMDLLSKRYREQNELSAENNAESGVNIFVKVTGTTDNPVFKTDKAGVINSVKTKIKNETTEMKNIFKSNTEPAAEKPAKFEKQTEPVFIEWDDKK